MRAVRSSIKATSSRHSKRNSQSEKMCARVGLSFFDARLSLTSNERGRSTSKAIGPRSRRNHRGPDATSSAFHEKAVKLFLKFISHFSRGGGIVLPSGLGMLVHVLIR